jgi:predicted phosphohydrolase
MIFEMGDPAMTKSITLAWATDIHLDHGTVENNVQFLDWVRSSGASALLLGGDITNAIALDDTLLEIAEMAGMPVHFVLGNHDYYGDSIAAVRKRMAELHHPDLTWLPASGPRTLAPGVTLVGHGGWGDARLGKFVGSPVFLSDYHAIKELKEAFDPKGFNGTFPADSELEAELRRQGQVSADTLAPHLEEAAKLSRQVIVLTHVPPFREATWHEGRHSDDQWLPGFSCGAMGDLLLATAAKNPDCRFTVLCGHTHGQGMAEMAPNLIVHTQGAEYGSPDFVLITARDNYVEVPS